MVVLASGQSLVLKAGYPPVSATATVPHAVRGWGKRMKLVVFGLSISSSWGNGHATLWRGIAAALAGLGHHLVFFERDVPYYREHRDLYSLPRGSLVLYDSWGDALFEARRHLRDADAAMVTSYCPDGILASDLVLSSRVPVRAFYDLDAPITLENVRAGRRVDYLPPEGLGAFDVVLSFTGGRALEELKGLLGARSVVPLYGGVDPAVHHPVNPTEVFRSDLSYLGTYAANRQAALQQLFLDPARRLPQRTFLIGGSMYPKEFGWTENLRYVFHVAPADHAAFFCSSRLTLNVTRAPMAAMGYCPSGRLFEAAACGTAIVSDFWEGLETFFTPGEEILVARTPEEVIAALERTDAELATIGQAARERALAEHTMEHRATALLAALERSRPAQAPASRPIRSGTER